MQFGYRYNWKSEQTNKKKIKIVSTDLPINEHVAHETDACFSMTKWVLVREKETKIVKFTSFAEM